MRFWQGKAEGACQRVGSGLCVEGARAWPVFLHSGTVAKSILGTVCFFSWLRGWLQPAGWGPAR